MSSSAAAAQATGSSAESDSGFVEISHVSKAFGGFIALNDVSLKITKGAFFSLLGPSGCGKTTLLRILSGFESSDAGLITLNGLDISRLPPERRPFNIVFQKYALFPHMTVSENVAFGLTTGGRGRSRRGEVDRRVREMLVLVELQGLDRRYPSQLSGGQAQRVALARALINEPSLLLLDEPLSALDPNVRQAMREHLLRVHRETGTTFLLVSHDQEEALSMSTHIALMNRGIVVQIGHPEELYRNPGSLFAARFIGSASFVEAMCLRIEGNTAYIDVKGRQHRCSNVNAAVGKSCVLVLRPEECQLAAQNGTCEGIVETRSFMGSHYELTVTTRFGLLRLRSAIPCPLGAPIAVSIADGAGACFASDG